MYVTNLSAYYLMPQDIETVKGNHHPVMHVQGCRPKTRPASSGCGTDEHFRFQGNGRHWRMTPASSCTLARWTGNLKFGLMGNTWACIVEGVWPSSPVLLILDEMRHEPSINKSCCIRKWWTGSMSECCIVFCLRVLIKA